MSKFTPKIAHANLDNRTVILDMPEDSPMPSGEFWLRGGVCWPKVRGDGPARKVEGAIVMLALDVQTKLAYAVESRSFITVENFLEKGKGGDEILMVGVADWFAKVWAKFFADHYYYHDREATHRKWDSDIYRNDTVKPKPAFTFVPWDDSGDEPEQTLWHWLATRRLKYESGGIVHRGLQEYTVDSNYKPAIVHALMAAVMGLTVYPYRATATD
jgi:hypothetical protein